MQILPIPMHTHMNDCSYTGELGPIGFDLSFLFLHFFNRGHLVCLRVRFFCAFISCIHFTGFFLS